MTRLWKHLVITFLWSFHFMAVPGVGSQTAPTATIPAPLQKDFAAEVPSTPEDFTGALDIRIHPEEGQLTPPADLLLRDPRGRKIGFDPRAGRTYREIPYAHYEFEGIDDAVSGAPGPQSGVIEIRNPLSGRYSLAVIGKETGHYTIEITGFDKNLETAKIFLKKAHIAPKAVRTFTFRYDARSGAGSVRPEEPAKLPAKTP